MPQRACRCTGVSVGNAQRRERLGCVVVMRATEIGDDRPVPDAGAPIDVHVYVEVSDLDRALAFYVGGLGLRELRRFTPHWVELAGARVPIHLLAPAETEFRAGAASPRGAHGR